DLLPATSFSTTGLAEVEQFNKQKLKKTNTQEKNHLPTKEGRSSLLSPLLWLRGWFDPSLPFF
uniref:Thymosin beta 1 n=1 Tax=Amphilophus citrinellus TaxID=61819 RepID=A0A3Q0REZ3_AMPCI